MRNRFTSQLEALNDGIIEMGALVEEAFAEATEALLYFNKEQAQRNIDNDKDIDQKMKDIETLCLRLLLSQQPVARDLRLISASLKMVSDLERIGDQCANISEIVLTLAQKSTNPAPIPVIPIMSTNISRMISQGIDAFVRKDLPLAKRVCDMDNIIDNAFIEAKKTLVESIRSNSAEADNVIDSFMIAKYLERIGDHAVNVAKWVVFAETGSREV
ncbi:MULTISPECIES: phosphate signaling complex protein PhoU [Fibrobacter]|uniref:Phosphate-specific transport system accessory protein PhoU n=1 Tax=Fibrobacter intestinalis TaxID=28122 RepID=A0A1M6PWK0_9BACT|nr:MULTISPECIES: phosphate signaling complex protein PhoU [Fibrobacter]MDD7298505.1 phosphate signaling complex protein PhoU [Fibrobacter intestinalis]PBC68910.1 phosphate transport system protein [Fibrobacter sp. UWS1]PBC74140.1 phosphate transport system protein [Fibrobacter sp. NR9]SHK12373.1 phosphate transport system protein [Fibrobacter intestinalis]SJZ32856.1 phosphate uptake regulator, PhoU [Fibrobacter intestinalis]